MFVPRLVADSSDVPIHSVLGRYHSMKIVKNDADTGKARGICFFRRVKLREPTGTQCGVIRRNPTKILLRLKHLLSGERVLVSQTCQGAEGGERDIRYDG